MEKSKFTIVVFGERCVGKNSILIRYVDGNFPEIPFGVPFRNKLLYLDNKAIQLNIFRPAEGEDFSKLPPMYFRNTNGILLVYSITSRDSFDRINFWMSEIAKFAPHDVKLVLVGNKCDLKDKAVVSIDEGKALAEELGIPFFETSAKDSTNIDEAFALLVKQMMKV